MADRLLWTLLVPAALCAPSSAQSSVRPLPRTAMSPELGFVLSREGSGSGARFDASTPGASRWEDLAAVPEAPEPVSQVDMKIEALYRPKVDFHDGPGAMSVARAGWDAELVSKVAEDRAFTVGLHTEASFYDFSGATTLVPGASDPFNDVYDTRLGASLCVSSGARTSWFTGFEAALSGEDEASLGESLSVGGVAGIRYQAHDDLALKLGFAAQSRLEDQAWIIPFLGFDWRLDDDWRLVTEGSRVRLQGDLGERWTIFGEAAYEARQYRLNEDNPLPEGVARDEQITVGAGLAWKPAHGVSLSLGGGIVAWHELTMLDKDGDQVSELETEKGPFVGFTLDLSF